MNRKGIIDKFAQRGYTKAAADVILKDVIAVFTEALVEGEEIRLHGFGTFSVRHTKDRTTKDIQTGENIFVPSFKTPKFVAGGMLKRAVKEGVARE